MKKFLLLITALTAGWFCRGGTLEINGNFASLDRKSMPGDGGLIPGTATSRFLNLNCFLTLPGPKGHLCIGGANDLRGSPAHLP